MGDKGSIEHFWSSVVNWVAITSYVVLIGNNIRRKEKVIRWEHCIPRTETQELSRTLFEIKLKSKSCFKWNWNELDTSQPHFKTFKRSFLSVCVWQETLSFVPAIDIRSPMRYLSPMRTNCDRAVHPLTKTRNGRPNQWCTIQCQIKCVIWDINHGTCPCLNLLLWNMIGCCESCRFRIRINRCAWRRERDRFWIVNVSKHERFE